MMKEILIEISKETRMVNLSQTLIGVDNENLQSNLIFKFTDEFVNGVARLDYQTKIDSNFIMLEKVEETYQLPIKNILTKEGQINMQLVITQSGKGEEIPVFKSNVFYVRVNKSINAETEAPEGYLQWIEIANAKLQELDEAVDDCKENGEFAREQGEFAKAQGEMANEVAGEIIEKAEGGDFDGKSLEFIWEGTRLGVRLEGETEYKFVDLEGKQGVKGDTGEPFKIKKTYSSINEMNQDFDNMDFGDYVMIASTVEEEDNAKLFTRGETEWIYITDFSGAMGIRGPVGKTPHLTIGNIATVETSEQASVTITGTDEEPVLNMSIPKGPKGETGGIGPIGPTGPAGKDGEVIQQEEIDKLQSEIDDLEGILDKETSTGTNTLEYDKAKAYKLFEGVYEGNEYQETTLGTNIWDEQWEQGVFNVTTGLPQANTSTIRSKNLTTVEPNTLYSSTKRAMWIFQYDENQELIENVGTEFPNIVQPPFTTNERCKYIKFYMVGYGGTYNNDIAIGKGATTTYEPYTNGPSPNPDYPQEVETLKSYQLWDEEYLQGYYNSSGQFTSANNQLCTKNLISVSPNTKLWLGVKQISLSFLSLCLYNKNGEFLSRINTTSYTGNGISYTTDNDTYYIKINFSAVYGATYNNDILICEETEKPYLPYNAIGVKRFGKNLFDKNKMITTGYFYNPTNNAKSTLANAKTSDYIRIKPNTSYVRNKKNGTDGATFFSVVSYYDENKNYLSGIWYSANSFTPPSNAKYFTIGNSAYKNDAAFDEFLQDFQIEEGTEATPFEPYKERIDYIKLEQENLTSKCTKSTLYPDGSLNTLWETTQRTNVGSLIYKYDGKVEDLVFAKTAGKMFRYAFTKNEPVKSEPTFGYVGTGITTEAKITTRSDCNYLVITYWNASDEITEEEMYKTCKLVKGELYDGSGLLSTDKVLVDNKGNVKLIKNWGKVVLDGSEVGWYKDTVVDDITRYRINGNDVDYILKGCKTINNIYATQRAYIKSNRYTSQQHSATNKEKNAMMVQYASAKWFILNSEKTTLEDFIQWLSNNNVEIYYELATPIEITLGTIEPIRTLEGTNNVEVLATLEPTSMSETYAYDLRKALSENVVEVGSYQYVYDGKVLPAIPVEKLRQAYEKDRLAISQILHWTLYGTENNLKIVSSDHIGGEYSIDVLIHNQYHCEYKWTDTTTGNVNPSVKSQN